MLREDHLELKDHAAADAFLTAADKPHRFRPNPDFNEPYMEVGWLAAIAAGQKTGQVLNLRYYSSSSLEGRDLRLKKMKAAARLVEEAAEEATAGAGDGLQVCPVKQRAAQGLCPHRELGQQWQEQHQQQFGNQWQEQQQRWHWQQQPQWAQRQAWAEEQQQQHC